MKLKPMHHLWEENRLYIKIQIIAMPNERNHLIHSYYYCTIYRKYSNLVKKLYYAESKSRKRDSHNLAVKNYYQLFSWQPKIGNLKGKT